MAFFWHSRRIWSVAWTLLKRCWDNACTLAYPSVVSVLTFGHWLRPSLCALCVTSLRQALPKSMSTLSRSWTSLHWSTRWRCTAASNLIRQLCLLANKSQNLMLRLRLCLTFIHLLIDIVLAQKKSCWLLTIWVSSFTCPKLTGKRQTKNRRYFSPNLGTDFVSVYRLSFFSLTI